MSLIFKKPRTSQPQGAWSLSDRLGAGAVAVVGGQMAAAGSSFAISGDIKSSATPAGLAFSSETLASYINIGRLPELGVGASIVCQFVNLSILLRYAAGTVDTGTNYIEDVAFNINASGAASVDRLYFALRSTGSATSRTCATDAVLTSGVVHTAVILVTSATSFSVFIDGRERAITYGTAGTISGGGALMDFPMALCNRNLRGVLDSGTGVKLLLYVRSLTPISDPASVSANPWQLFAPLPRRIWAPGAAGTPFKPAWAIGSNAVIGAGAMA